MNKYTENLFDAIKLTTESIISSLSFDKTINCSIVNIQDRSKRIYTITDGTSNFTAIGNEDYSIGDNVYVLIPQGDYNQQKTIIGKKQSNEEINGNSSKPFDQIVPFFSHSDLNTEYQLIVNSGNKELELFSLENLNIEKYSLLGISSLFNISDCDNSINKDLYQEINTGTYGIIINVVGISRTTGLALERNYIFNNDSFFGNSYLYLEDGNLQEFAFDISEFKKITSIKGIFHQLDDFKYLYFDEKSDKDIVQDLPYGEEIKNVSIKNIELILGNNINEYKNNDLIIEDFNNNFNYSLAPGENNERIVIMNFLRSNAKKELYNNNKPLDLFYSDKPIYVSKNDELITDINNLILVYQEAEENIMSIGVEDDEGGLTDSNTSDEIAISPLRYSYFNYLLARDLISIDWFKYKIDENIRDDILGEFWEKQIKQSNPFRFNFIAENEYREKIKSLISFKGQLILEKFEYKEDGSIDKKLEPYSPLTEIDITDTITNLERQYTLEGYTCFTDFKKLSSLDFLDNTIIDLNPSDKEADKREYLFIAATKKEGENKYTPAVAVWLQTDLDEPISIISNELIYYNSASQLEVQSSINLIKDLTLECMDAENGYYYKYNVDNTISSTEATQNRSLNANFTIVSAEGLKVNDPFIQWSIPAINTMIEPPKDWTLSEDGLWYLSNMEQIINKNVAVEEGEEYPLNSFAIGEKDEEIKISQSLNYQIKQVYSSYANNNTIKCSVWINNNENKIEKTLWFGPMGTNGTKYTFVASLGERYESIFDETLQKEIPNLDKSLSKTSSFSFTDDSWTKIDLKLYDSERKESSLPDTINYNINFNTLDIAQPGIFTDWQTNEIIEKIKNNSINLFSSYIDKNNNYYLKLNGKKQDESKIINVKDISLKTIDGIIKKPLERKYFEQRYTYRSNSIQNIQFHSMCVLLNISFTFKNGARMYEGDSFTLTKEGTIEFKDRIVVEMLRSDMNKFLDKIVKNSTGNGTYHIFRDAFNYIVYEYSEQDNSEKKVATLTGTQFEDYFKLSGSYLPQYQEGFFINFSNGIPTQVSKIYSYSLDPFFIVDIDKFTLQTFLTETSALQKEINFSQGIWLYNNQPIDSLNLMGIELIEGETFSDGDQILLNYTSEVYPEKSIDLNEFNSYSSILQAEIKQNDLSLTTYLPLPISFSQELYQGTDKIIYNSSGSNASFYKSLHKLYTKDQQEINNLKWSIFVDGQKNVSTNYPMFKEDNTLSIPGIYLNNFYDNKKISIIVEDDNNKILFIQPIIIKQNAYENSLLNEWDEKISIDTENGSILSTVMGAGTKDEDNKFSGVLMGDFQPTGMNVETGLFGFNKGLQSFGFKTDGTAFLGTSQSGRIVFDGTGGLIASHDCWQAGEFNKALGTWINLQSGSFSFANEKLSFDSDNNKLKLKNVDIDWSTSNTFDISTGDVSGLDPYLQTTSELQNTTSELQNTTKTLSDVLNSVGINYQTQIGSQYVISPYIKGGYLQIINDSKQGVTIDPYNLTQTGKIFFITDKNGEEVVKIDTSGNVIFKGTINAIGGTIGGWNIAAPTYNSDGSLNEPGAIYTQKLLEGGGSFEIGLRCPTVKGEYGSKYRDVLYVRQIDANGVTTYPFHLSSSGTVRASNLLITGGSITLGTNFSVTSEGSLTAKTGRISFFTFGEKHFGASVGNFTYVFNDELFLAGYIDASNNIIAQLQITDSDGGYLRIGGKNRIDIETDDIITIGNHTKTTSTYMTQIHMKTQHIYTPFSVRVENEVSVEGVLKALKGKIEVYSVMDTNDYSFAGSLTAGKGSTNVVYLNDSAGGGIGLGYYNDNIGYTLYPHTASNSGVYSLGCADRRWATLYTTHANITGTLTGKYIRLTIKTDQADWGSSTDGLGVLTIGTTENQMRIDQNEIVVVNSSSALATLYLQASTVQCSNILKDGNGTVSDKRLKVEESKEILEKDLLIYDTLNPVVYKYKNLFKNDNYNRTHIGFFAQDVENLIKEQGLTNLDCALIQAQPVDNNLEIFTDGKKYHLNYDELHGLHVLKNQRQDAEIKELKEKIKILEEKISKLETTTL